MQRSFRWQPHLPFFPVNLPYEKWAERYNYTFLTLPIIQLRNSSWTLDPKVSNSWYRHVDFFSNVISTWRHQLAMAPMSVDFVPDIRGVEFYREFPEELAARRTYWYYRSLIFSMFAEFAFLVSGRPNWRRQLTLLFENKGLSEAWVDEVEKALCDFRHTKRAGVIIDVGRTELWQFIRRYHENGVPILMEVGWVTFHDNDPYPTPPTFDIQNFTPPLYSNLPKDWPITREPIIEKAKAFLRKNWYHRLGFDRLSAPPPLTISRPNVDRLPTRPWVNPSTNQSCPQITVIDPLPTSHTMGWVEFFERRREANKKREALETPRERNIRLDRIRNAKKINQKGSAGPGKKAEVFRWTTGVENLPVGMQEDPNAVLKRVKLIRPDVEIYWDDYAPTQRLYDPFLNQWDLNFLFDVDPPPESFDDDDDSFDDSTHIDRINLARNSNWFDQDSNTSTNPAGAPFPPPHIPDDDFPPPPPHISDDDFPPSSPPHVLDDSLPPITAHEIQEEEPPQTLSLMSTEISFIAPHNFADWLFLLLGLKAVRPPPTPVVEKKAKHVIGYIVNEEEFKSLHFEIFQEFFSYMDGRRFDELRLSEICDLDPGHPSFLNLDNLGLYIHRVRISAHQSGTPYRIGYQLSPKNDDPNTSYCWVLVLFEAISVVQVIRNSWGTSTMEELIRQLIRHGIQFRTLVPATQVLPDAILKLNEAPEEFTTLPPLNLENYATTDDYSRYLEMRQAIIRSPHGRVAFRMGGILWRLAMESLENFDDVINEILAGPSEMGALRGQYFYMEGQRYYDLVVKNDVSLTICGVYGIKTGQYMSPGCKFFFWNFVFLQN